jgi:hypothetical protein
METWPKWVEQLNDAVTPKVPVLVQSPGIGPALRPSCVSRSGLCCAPHSARIRRAALVVTCVVHRPVRGPAQPDRLRRRRAWCTSARGATRSRAQ